MVGLGKLGLPLALVFAKAGFIIKAVEISKKRLSEIGNGVSMSEPKVNEYMKKYWKHIWIDSVYSRIAGCPVVFVVVQTPSLANHVFDTQYVEAAVKAVHKVNTDCLIAISSTVPPKTCDNLTKIHRRIAYNPEFIKQGSIIDDFENPKFVMFGAYNYDDYNEGCNRVWGKIFDGKRIMLKPLEAEIAKLALNVSFCKDITFANVIGEFCESMGANSKAVMDVVNLDKRSYQAGLGYGGVCFPRDTRCLRAMSKVKGEMFMDALHEVNDDVIWDYSRRILKKKGDIAFIGLTYKRGVPIIEESSAMNILTLVTHTLKDGIKKSKREIHVYDECGKEVYHQLKDFGGIIAYIGLENAIKNVGTVFFGLPIKAPPKLLKGKRVIDPWGLNK